MEKRKSGDKSILHPISVLTLPLSSKNAMQKSTTQFPPLIQRLHKLEVLQKLSCQKPYWDQARLSSLSSCLVFIVNRGRVCAVAVSVCDM